jgi:amidase
VARSRDARSRVKDVIDVGGFATGAGNPDFAADALIAVDHAPAVRRMLDAGATLLGKTITDELAFSLSGTNVHYGTPPNPAAPGCIPGGSSSGSASAVATAVVDLALGTDTAGCGPTGTASGPGSGRAAHGRAHVCRPAVNADSRPRH